MILSKEQPNIYPLLHQAFGVEWENGIIITYGDTVHCKYDLTPDKIAHEQVHVDQQRAQGKLFWWSMYLFSSKFRLDQELEAYRAEAAFIKERVRDRNLRAKCITDICRDLSGPMYGNIITFDEAKKILQ